MITVLLEPAKPLGVEVKMCLSRCQQGGETAEQGKVDVGG